MVDGEFLGSQSGTSHCYSMKNEDIPYHTSWLENGEMGKKVTQTFKKSTFFYLPPKTLHQHSTNTSFFFFFFLLSSVLNNQHIHSP